MNDRSSIQPESTYSKDKCNISCTQELDTSTKSNFLIGSLPKTKENDNLEKTLINKEKKTELNLKQIKPFTKSEMNETYNEPSNQEKFKKNVAMNSFSYGQLSFLLLISMQIKEDNYKRINKCLHSHMMLYSKFNASNEMRFVFFILLYQLIYETSIHRTTKEFAYFQPHLQQQINNSNNGPQSGQNY